MNARFMFYDEDGSNDWDGISHADIDDLSMNALLDLLNEVRLELVRRQKNE